MNKHHTYGAAVKSINGTIQLFKSAQNASEVYFKKVHNAPFRLHLHITYTAACNN